MQEINGNSNTLIRRASIMVDLCLAEAIECINCRLGEGYAQKNPNLIAAFLQTSAMEITGGVLAQRIHAGLKAIAEEIYPPDMEPVADALNKIADNLGDDLTIAEALNRVADKLDRVAYGLSDGYDGDPTDSVPNALRSMAKILSRKRE